MLGSVAINPNFVYSLSPEDSALLESIAKNNALQILEENQKLVDGPFSRFFRRTIEEGLITGPDGQTFKPSPEEMEVLLAEFKEGLLNHLMKGAKERLQESGEKKLAQAKQLGREALTEQFWSVFNGKTPLPPEKYNEIFNTYLADSSLTVEKNSEGKNCGRINSMNSVIQYLKTHPLTKTCDFRTFKTEVNDIGTLANFLKTSDAFGIKGVAFKSGIAEIAKTKLAEAVAARAATQSPLKVQYFA
jgi:hypothetical protein